MKRNGNRILFTGMIMLLFTIWTILIQTVDVQAAGQNGTGIGLCPFSRQLRFRVKKSPHFDYYAFLRPERLHFPEESAILKLRTLPQIHIKGWGLI